MTVKHVGLVLEDLAGDGGVGVKEDADALAEQALGEVEGLTLDYVTELGPGAERTP